MTTIRLKETNRNRLRDFKKEQGMTYDGAIEYLLDQEKTKQTERKTKSEDRDLARRPTPDEWYREGVDGASDFVIAILQSQLVDANEYASVAKSAVWETYSQNGIEPRIDMRETSRVSLTLSDLIEFLSIALDESTRHSVSGAASEIKYLSEKRAHIISALDTYRKMEGGEIPMESNKPPNLAVAPDRTYRARKSDDEYVVFADNNEIDLSSYQNQEFNGRQIENPYPIATAILEDAYQSEHYARSRRRELYNEFVSKNLGEEVWEISAGKLKQYLTDKTED